MRPHVDGLDLKASLFVVRCWLIGDSWYLLGIFASMNWVLWLVFRLRTFGA
jgi:hypothetical protein